MARKQGWALFFALVLGIIGASLFWLYGPWMQREVAYRVAQEMKGRQVSLEVSKGGGPGLQGAPFSAVGHRYQLTSDGRHTFMADLKEGRVWRYYHHTKEGGYAREEEGFAPVPLYFGGKKYYSARDLGQPPPAPGEVKPQ